MSVRAEELAREVERLFALLVKRRPEEAEAEPQLTGTQRLALALVVDEGPLRLGELADRMATTDPTATRTVDGLEEARLVERRADPRDRRAVQVAATAAGRRLLQRRRARFVQILRGPLDGFSEPDRQHLLGLIAALNRALER